MTDVRGWGSNGLGDEEERGLGKTLDLILHRGKIRKGDEIVISTVNGAICTHVKGLFSPRGMSEMRDAGDRWDTEVAFSAAGIKIGAPSLEGVLVGTTLRVVDSRITKIDELAESEATLSIVLEEEGVCIKSDTVGGLKL